MRLDSYTEYESLKDRVAKAGVAIHLEKKHGTPSNFSEILRKKP